jgi:hypothetical protein
MRRPRKKLIFSLKLKKVKNLTIGRNWISFEYDDEKIKNKIVIKKHVDEVGDWYSKNKNEVYVNRDLGGKNSVRAVALHESIEKFVTKKYGLDIEEESHMIADVVEKRFLECRGFSWRRHQERVCKVWENEQRYRNTKMRFSFLSS